MNPTKHIMIAADHDPAKPSVTLSGFWQLMFSIEKEYSNDRSISNEHRPNHQPGPGRDPDRLVASAPAG